MAAVTLIIVILLMSGLPFECTKSSTSDLLTCNFYSGQKQPPCSYVTANDTWSFEVQDDGTTVLVGMAKTQITTLSSPTMKMPLAPVCVFFRFYISDVKHQQFTYAIVRPNSPPEYLKNTNTDGKKAGWNDFAGTINNEQGEDMFLVQLTIYRDHDGFDTLVKFTSFNTLDGRCDEHSSTTTPGPGTTSTTSTPVTTSHPYISTTTSVPPQEGSGMSGGWIFGIVVSLLSLIGILIFAGFKYYKRNKYNPY